MNLANPETYSEDGRISTSKLQESYNKLSGFGWQSEIIAIQDGFSITAFTTPLIGNSPVKSLWILGGIHGEEPAGPNAFSTQIETINNLAKEGIPVVFIPLLNPLGYSRDWRYENEKRDFRLGHSVGNAEHLLLNNEEKKRIDSPQSQTAKQILKWVTKTISEYQPDLVFDHHEDRVTEIYPQDDSRNLTSCYVYLSGNSTKGVDIAKGVNQILKNSGLPVVDNGTTRFGEEIVDGIVTNISDGSIDEFFASEKYFDTDTQKIVSKHPAQVVLVVETTVPFGNSIPLAKRQTAHEEIIKSYGDFWKRLK